MLGVTGFGLLFTPAFYTLMQRMGVARPRELPDQHEPLSVPSAHSVLNPVIFSSRALRHVVSLYETVSRRQRNDAAMRPEAPPR
jgi:hypothetical protein